MSGFSFGVLGCRALARSRQMASSGIGAPNAATFIAAQHLRKQRRAGWKFCAAFGDLAEQNYASTRTGFQADLESEFHFLKREFQIVFRLGWPPDDPTMAQELRRMPELSTGGN